MGTYRRTTDGNEVLSTIYHVLCRRLLLCWPRLWVFTDKWQFRHRLHQPESLGQKPSCARHGSRWGNAYRAFFLRLDPGFCTLPPSTPQKIASRVQFLYHLTAQGLWIRCGLLGLPARVWATPGQCIVTEARVLADLAGRFTATAQSRQIAIPKLRPG